MNLNFVNKTNKTPRPNFSLMSCGCFPETRQVFLAAESMVKSHIDNISHNC